jgi:4-amino-4-deoxy-L-arabinose transferase-like glycosyltransferase
MALLAAGAVLRLVLLASYTPAYLSYPDTWGYAKAAAGPLFMDDWIRPAGYPAVLAALHALWASLTFVIVVQHVVALATAALAYATLLRMGAPRWVALVPAAVLALTLDSIYFEHTLLSETWFTLLVTAALYAATRSLEPGATAGWALGCGALLATATAVRGMGLFLIPVYVLVLLLGDGRARERLRRAAMVGVAAGALLLGYAAVQHSQNGYFGLTEGSGWATYARAAPFADCRQFTPPRGTEGLCDPTDARLRPGPDWYAWSPNAPARPLFGGPPQHSRIVGSFGRAAIRAQPRAYVRAVATDLWRYVDPDAGIDRIGDGDPPSRLDISHRKPIFEQLNATQVERLYGPVDVHVSRAVDWLAAIQRVVRVHGVLVLAALLLSLAGLALTRGRARAHVLLLAGTAVVPIVLATATTIYNWRYIVPLLPALTAAGALGAALATGRVMATLRIRSRRPLPRRSPARVGGRS